MNPHNPFFHEERHAPLGVAAGRPITVCGVGALGGNIAETLARMGFTQLTLIDRDRVEARNLSTQPYMRGEIGAPKARALATMLYRAVGCRVTPIVVELTEQNAARLLDGSVLVVDAFDNSAARGAVSTATRAAGLSCLHVGFSSDGLYGSGLWEPGYRVPRDGMSDACDYPLTRPLALVLAALAARAIRVNLAEGLRRDVEVTWTGLGVSEHSAPPAQPALFTASSPSATL